MVVFSFVFFFFPALFMAVIWNNYIHHIFTGLTVPQLFLGFLNSRGFSCPGTQEGNQNKDLSLKGNDVFLVTLTVFALYCFRIITWVGMSCLCQGLPFSSYQNNRGVKSTFWGNIRAKRRAHPNNLDCLFQGLLQAYVKSSSSLDAVWQLAPHSPNPHCHFKQGLQWKARWSLGVRLQIWHLSSGVNPWDITRDA